MTKFIKIEKKKVGENFPCFIIAEASINHNGKVSLAKKMALEAKKSGADCIKYQTFTASEFCADKNQKIKLISHGKKKVWNLYNLYKMVLQINSMMRDRSNHYSHHIHHIHP